MHIHNFLIDYRNTLASPESDNEEDRSIFIDEMCDNGINNIVVGNDNHRGEGGIPTNDKRERRMKGVLIRDNLKTNFMNHNMYRKNNNKGFDYDRSNHIVME